MSMDKVEEVAKDLEVDLEALKAELRQDWATVNE